MNRVSRLIVPACLLLCGCRFFPGEREVTVEIPPLPPAVDGSVENRVELELVSSGGERQLVSARAGERVRLRTARAALTACVVRYSGGVPPAGAVLPADGETSGVLPLRFRAGLVSEILLRLCLEGVPAECVDYRRLRSEMDAVSGGNPCRLDGDRIVTALLSGRFSSRDIVLLPEYTLPAGALPPGIWKAANPMAPALAAETAARVSEGRHVLYGEGEIITLWCAAEGWRVYRASGLTAGGW